MTATAYRHDVEQIANTSLVLLLAHAGGDRTRIIDWSACGTTCSVRQCMARAVSSGEQCPKEAVVILPTVSTAVALCGGHFGVHRRGTSVTIMGWA